MKREIITKMNEEISSVCNRWRFILSGDDLQCGVYITIVDISLE